jgi:hypothetical protein
VITTIKMPIEVDISLLEIDVPVRYEEEEIPNDFPLRAGERWAATINLDTHVIENWPKGRPGRLYLTVRDSGSYRLISRVGELVAERNDYVPNKLIPGKYGDVIDMTVDENGKVTNWPANPSVEAFFKNEDDE